MAEAQATTAVVTGGGRGIGAAVARTLAAAGFRIAVLDRTGAEEAASALPGPAIGCATDVSDPAAVEAAVARAEDELGPIGALVSTAGVLRPGGVLELSDDDWAAHFAVNATGVMNAGRAVARRMVARRAGAIVTVASNAARVPRTRLAAYAASKAAAVQFTKCLGLELAEHGIRCNVVSPGSTDTAMQRDLWADPEAGARAAVDGDPGSYRTGIPLGRVADPQDVADAVAFLLSDRARHITMHDLYVDGGASLRG
ncbi:2,3-dihydro-2,3-dihydroxybenzoate dehydrogenase [Actinomadura parmotrematis]|uniref:2,3-dihydro-2,3-dihydroxybenzoate dehydrogenase n=1 Tax=Actinomadura parmotrematis TaxID=2864039 RepID=A0ABS7G165_9ACTN|nr:2,3-dihydro-2,3-dihydroxybenzoate dehydrogenase [Actinomadura parmotrematis]MBW8486130.1 2,3-dihydro-2,3-dihydroxybenzoate dehydrogenase [Actinomadura parmotrematis]